MSGPIPIAPPGDLTGRRALVSGGVGGLGRAIAAALARAGAQVTIADLSAQAGAQAAESLGGQGLDVGFHPLDVTRAADWQAAVSATRPQILVNCAGLAERRGILDCDLDSLQRLFAVNVTGSCWACARSPRR